MSITSRNIDKAREEAIALESEGGIYYIPPGTYKNSKEMWAVAVKQQPKEQQ